MVALALFSGALLVIMALFPTASAAAHRGRQLQGAVRLAESEVERLRPQPYDTLASSITSVSNPWTHDGQTGVTVFTLQTTVSEPLLDLKRLEVSVSWTDDETHLVRLETMVARR